TLKVSGLCYTVIDVKPTRSCDDAIDAPYDGQFRSYATCEECLGLTLFVDSDPCCGESCPTFCTDGVRRGPSLDFLKLPPTQICREFNSTGCLTETIEYSGDPEFISGDDFTKDDSPDLSECIWRIRITRTRHIIVYGYTGDPGPCDGQSIVFETTEDASYDL